MQQQYMEQCAEYAAAAEPAGAAAKVRALGSVGGGRGRYCCSPSMQPCSDSDMPCCQGSKRPSWLEDIVSQGKEQPDDDDYERKSGGKLARSPPPEAEPPQADAKKAGWDERWGYGKPVWKGSGGNDRGRGREQPPPERPQKPARRGWKMQRCPKWAQWKCKKGDRCPFAHGDHELMPKEMKQQLRREQEQWQRHAEEARAAREDGDAQAPAA